MEDEWNPVKDSPSRGWSTGGWGLYWLILYHWELPALPWTVPAPLNLLLQSLTFFVAWKSSENVFLKEGTKGTSEAGTEIWITLTVTSSHIPSEVNGVLGILWVSKYRTSAEFCSKPYCGALIPQSVNRHLDAGRLIYVFIWQSSCCQLHTSVPTRDKITFPIKMNTHASAFLLGRFPPQCCGVVYCHVLKSLRLDVVLTSFHMQLSRSSRPDIVWVLPWCWPWTLQLAAQQIWKWRKKRPACGSGVPCAAQQTALSWACLLVSWMCNILVPVVADPQVAALSPNKVCSSQLDVVLTSLQTSFQTTQELAWVGRLMPFLRWWCFVVFLWWCFCGGDMVVFLWWCLCGGVCVVVFAWWWFCGGVFVVVFAWWCLCGGVCVVLFLWWCFCGGVFVFLWWCGGVFVVVFLWLWCGWCFCGGVFAVVVWWFFCGGVFGVVWLCFCNGVVVWLCCWGGGVVVFLCCGVFLWWCGCVFVVGWLCLFCVWCGGVFAVVWWWHLFSIPHLFFGTSECDDGPLWSSGQGQFSSVGITPAQ